MTKKIDTVDEAYADLEKMRLQLPADERENAVVKFISPIRSATPDSFSTIVGDSILSAKGKTVLSKEYNFKTGRMVIALGDEETLGNVMKEVQRRASILE